MCQWRQQQRWRLQAWQGWCLPCFGFLFFDPLGLAQQAEDRRSTVVQAEGVSHNSRQGRTMMTGLSVHAEDAAVCTENWFQGRQQPDYSGRTLMCLKPAERWEGVAHRGRRQWAMLCSWWVVRRFSGSARCPYITSQPWKKRRSGQKFTFIRRNPFPASCVLTESNLGHLGQHLWVWRALQCQLEATQSKRVPQRLLLQGCFDKEQADWAAHVASKGPVWLINVFENACFNSHCAAKENFSFRWSIICVAEGCQCLPIRGPTGKKKQHLDGVTQLQCV